MTTATLTMSHPELERCEVMRRVHKRRLTQREAAHILGLSLRQVERLSARYKRQGPEGLVSNKRGKRSKSPSARTAPRDSCRARAGLVRRLRTHASVDPR